MNMPLGNWQYNSYANWHCIATANEQSKDEAEKL